MIETTEQGVFQLTKHMQSLELKPGMEGILILRPRYQISGEQASNLYKSLTAWHKTNAPRLRMLLVPHDIDVFVFAKGLKDDAKGNKDSHQKDDANAHSESEHVDARQSESPAACASEAAAEPAHP